MGVPAERDGVRLAREPTVYRLFTPENFFCQINYSGEKAKLRLFIEYENIQYHKTFPLLDIYVNERDFPSVWACASRGFSSGKDA